MPQFPVSLTVLEHVLHTLMTHSGPTPYLIVFGILIACGFGLPMPEDVILFAAGMMSFYGSADVWIMIGVCFCGVVLGDTSVYTIGAVFGRRLRKTPLVKKLLPPARMRMVRRKLHEQGNKVIFAARFMPGLRTPVFFTSGTLHLPVRVFLFYDGLAALISVPTIVYATFYFGDHVDRVVHVVKRIQFGVVGSILLIVAVIAFKGWWGQKKERELEREAELRDALDKVDSKLQE
jgi:membrane protein DedA with SNARE-associated domain